MIKFEFSFFRYGDEISGGCAWSSRISCGQKLLAALSQVRLEFGLSLLRKYHLCLNRQLEFS